MITLQEGGHYTLIETKHANKVLYLNNNMYAWIKPANIGEILIIIHRVHKTDYILSIGGYNLYKVEDEPHLSDHIHLELEVGKDTWQGYLLLTGLPSDAHSKGRIIPTNETITANPDYDYLFSQ